MGLAAYTNQQLNLTQRLSVGMVSNALNIPLGAAPGCQSCKAQQHKAPD